jgi:hypothetical protein
VPYYRTGKYLIIIIGIADARISEVEGKRCTIKTWRKSNKHFLKRFFYKWRENLAKKKMKRLAR